MTAYATTSAAMRLTRSMMRVATATILLTGAALAQQSGVAAGKIVYAEKARCLFCHSWDGSGDASEYGGDAPSLRKTELTRDQIMEVVRCGRPGKGMPAHDKMAYQDNRCYGLTEKDMEKGDLPPKPFGYLLDREVEAVADYIGSLHGRGEPDKAECQAFFGSSSRVCDRYK